MNDTKKEKYKKDEESIILEQQGGVKLGHGGFGCVIAPAVSCKRRPLPKNAVSKITYVLPGYERDYEDELSMLNRIKQLDPQQKYFVSVNDECSLDTRIIQNRVPKDVVEVSYEDDDLETFRVKPSEPKYISMMNNNDITKKYCLIDDYLEPRNQVLEFGGYSLYHITPDKFPELYSSIKRNYKSIIRNLLSGLQLLHTNRIAHRDIKEDNILGIIIDTYRNTQTATQKSNKTGTKKKQLNHTKQGKPITKDKSRKKISHPLVRFIDFGLSNMINPKLDEGGIRNFHWSGTDGYIPIDFVLLHYMEDYVLTYGASVLRNQVNKQRILEKTQARYEKAYKAFYDDIHIEQSLIHKKHRHSQKQNKYVNQQQIFGYEFLDMVVIRRIYDKLANSLINNTFYKIMKTDYVGFIYKSDIFALGITLAFMRRHYRLHHDKNLTDLISRMIKLNPDDRPNINDCMSHPFVRR